MESRILTGVPGTRESRGREGVGGFWEKAGGGRVEDSPGGYGSHVCTDGGGFCDAGKGESWEGFKERLSTRLAPRLMVEGEVFHFSQEGVGRLEGNSALC